MHLELFPVAVTTEGAGAIDVGFVALHNHHAVVPEANLRPRLLHGESAVSREDAVPAYEVGYDPPSRVPEARYVRGLDDIEEHLPATEVIHCIHHLLGEQARLGRVPVRFPDPHDPTTPLLLRAPDLIHRHLPVAEVFAGIPLHPGPVREGPVLHVDAKLPLLIQDEAHRDLSCSPHPAAASVGHKTHGHRYVSGEHDIHVGEVHVLPTLQREPLVLGEVPVATDKVGDGPLTRGAEGPLHRIGRLVEHRPDLVGVDAVHKLLRAPPVRPLRSVG
mmetsp:Transcript_100180/g.299022  ORF Transcript_100180/g.299022 Transcript_100180/m.299022 type:complete len:275 (-) Transcript_100180:1301-2125(-)